MEGKHFKKLELSVGISTPSYEDEGGQEGNGESEGRGSVRRGARKPLVGGKKRGPKGGVWKKDKRRG